MNNLLERKYIIYGLNRVSKDFMYVFSELDVVCILDDCDDEQVILNAKAEYPDAQIIICDFSHDYKDATMRRLGFKYEVDYVYEEDFFSLADEIDFSTKRHIYVWGAGRMGGYLLRECSDIIIDSFIDSNNSISEYEGYRVVLPEKINWEDEIYIIVSVDRNREIVEYLKKRGKKYITDFCVYYDVIGLPSRMLRKTIFDRNFYNIECHTMLNHLEVLTEGNTRCCCTTFVNQNLGNVLLRKSNEIWKSYRHRIMCLSIENHTYTFCDKKMCPLFVGVHGKKLDNLQYKEWQYGKPLDKPETLVAGFDASCNLRCETCRKAFYYADENERMYQMKIIDKILRDYITDVKFLILAGDGEVFASQSYQSLYMNDNCKPKYIRLLTNGMLFNKNNWNKLIKGKNCKVMMTVSIDAATKKTYEKIRRGGNFDILKRNMEYASELRNNGELAYLRFNFVVQRDNYLEIPDFIKWGEELGVDEVFFTKILNWGTYTSEEFSEVSMMEMDGITPKLELKKIIQSDTVQMSRIVDLGTIQDGHKVDYVDVVTNYYMWELEKRGGRIFK